MKSILLTSTALVAFAGAAAADGHSSVGFAGEATLGYNTTDGVNDTVSKGMYWDSSVDATMSAELDNGLMASATFGLSVADNNLGDTVTSSDFVLSLSNDNASLKFGDVDPVAEDRFGGVDGDSTAGFIDQDMHLNSPTDPDAPGAGFESILVGETTFAGFTGAVSFGVDGDGTTAAGVEAVDAMQAHIAGSFGMFDVELGYQDELAGADAVIGVAAGATFSGATVRVSYIDDGTENSTGISASYPVGPVTVSGYYSMNDVAEDNYGLDLDYAANGATVNVFYDVDGGEGAADDVASYGIEGSYAIGNGITAYAGYLSGDAAGQNDTMYVAGTYDLGGGASILASYADDGDSTTAGEDLGDPEYQEGMTIEVSFAF